jgi:nitrogen fixation protein FixH
VAAGKLAGEPLTWPSAPQPRNLWPVGIVAAFAVFIAATATLIVLSTSQRDDLVATDYYARELRYQDQIESAERTRHVRDQVHVTHDAARQQIDLTLPPQHARQRPAGLIQLYRPSAADQDLEIPLDLDLAGHQRLDAHTLGPGLWRVRVRWTVDGDDYAVDERIVIPKRL